MFTLTLNVERLQKLLTFCADFIAFSRVFNFMIYVIREFRKN